ncbi:MAG: hypothetical protein CM15mP23_21090 [Cryomorphaceae bacterium]|nr:MAG: hypothetical protein CM15mP23_21090 [Cryomorphaceae bacterium]
MDGARLFHAMVYTNTKPIDYGPLFDSISVCMSKGLGAPLALFYWEQKHLFIKPKGCAKF